MKRRSLLPLFLLFFISCYSQSTKTPDKINGVSFVAPAKPIGQQELSQPKEKINASYLSLMPYAFIPEGSTELQYNNEWQWWGEKAEGTQQIIQTAKKMGYKIMLKPHVWKRHGEFTGHHTYDNENEWLAFEKAYRTYILDFADLAEKEKVEIFCIGTEWGKFVEERPEFWEKLTQEVKAIYSGKLTYAANWDEYKKVKFWKELDYIGVDAYFPLVEEKTPNKDNIKYALLRYSNEMQMVSKSYDRPILFTEFGYRSRDKTADKPWESDRNGSTNLKGQTNAYEAFFESLWSQNYIAGGFIWKWFADYENVGGPKHNGYTPQNKPVEKVIKKWYSY